MGVRVRGSHTYVNITDENLCARNLRIVGLVQKVRNFDASKISTFTVCTYITQIVTYNYSYRLAGGLSKKEATSNFDRPESQVIYTFYKSATTNIIC